MISSNAETIQSSFTAQAGKFETKSMNFANEEYLKYMVSCIAPDKSDNVLEVAAGTCVCGRALAPFVENVTCLDMTDAMLKVGKEKSEEQKLQNLSFVQGNAETLPFPDNSFDIVISRLAFHHFTAPECCFSEMARVLAPGGKLVVIDMEAPEEPLRKTVDKIETMRDPSHIHTLSRAEFNGMFCENNLLVTMTDCIEIPVCVSSWLALTDTPTDISADILLRFKVETEGGLKTGFYPYIKNGELYFNHRWLMMIGKK